MTEEEERLLTEGREDAVLEDELCPYDITLAKKLKVNKQVDDFYEKHPGGLIELVTLILTRFVHKTNELKSMSSRFEYLQDMKTQKGLELEELNTKRNEMEKSLHPSVRLKPSYFKTVNYF